MLLSQFLWRVRPSARSTRPEDGLTLIECLVAIVVIGIASAAVAPALVIAAGSRVQSQRTEQAISLARAEIDRVRVTLDRSESILRNLNLRNLNTDDPDDPDAYIDDYIALLPPPICDDPEPPSPPADDDADDDAGDDADDDAGDDDVDADEDPDCDPLALQDTPYPNTATTLLVRDTDISIPKDTREAMKVSSGDTDFAIQVFRTPGRWRTMPGDRWLPVRFRVGVRVYDLEAFESGSIDSTEPIRLGMTGGFGQRIRQPLTVIYADVSRADFAESLCAYFGGVEDANPDDIDEDDPPDPLCPTGCVCD